MYDNQSVNRYNVLSKQTSYSRSVDIDFLEEEEWTSGELAVEGGNSLYCQVKDF